MKSLVNLFKLFFGQLMGNNKSKSIDNARLLAVADQIEILGPGGYLLSDNVDYHALTFFNLSKEDAKNVRKALKSLKKRAGERISEIERFYHVKERA